MTYKQYITYIDEYINLGCSSNKLLEKIGFSPEHDLSAEGLLKAVNIISAVAEKDIKRLVELSGLKGATFCKKFGLPYRTFSSWIRNQRNPAEYLLTLIGFVLITELPCYDEPNEAVKHGN